MKKRRWIMRGLTMGICTAFLLTGCGGSTAKGEGSAEGESQPAVKTAKLDPDNPVEINMWHYYNGVQQQMFDELIDEFNNTVGAEEGIIVNTYSQGTTNDLVEKLEDSVEGKVGAEECPDMFSSYADAAYEWDQEGKLVDLSEYFTEEELGEYVGSYIEEGTFNNKGLKLFPVAKSTEVFVLNKTDWDKFAQETGAEEKNLSTWEGIAQTAEQYYDWSGGKAFFGRDALANYIFVGSAQLGKEVYTVDENGTATYQMDKEIFKKLWDNYYVPYINGYYAAEGKFRSDDAKTGTIIACVASSSSANYFPSEVTKEDGDTYAVEAEVFSTPNFEGCDSMAIQQGAGVALFKTDEQKQYACVEFLKWLTDTKQNTLFSQNSGYLPVKKEAQLEKNLTDVEVDDITKQTLEVTLDMADTYEYYTTQTFDKAYDVRVNVGYSMQDKADEDKKEIEKLEKNGSSHEEAVAAYDTEENFETWFAQLETSLGK